jgi:hypothetical protein
LVSSDCILKFAFCLILTDFPKIYLLVFSTVSIASLMGFGLNKIPLSQ